MSIDQDDAMIALLKKFPGMTAAQLTPLIGWKKQFTRRVLCRLNDVGLVRRENCAARRKPTGSRVEYRYWFKPKEPVEVKLAELLR